MEKNFDELEEMKQQITLLKKKLDNETIVNDKLMRSVVSTKIGNLERQLSKIFILGVIAMVLNYFNFTMLIKTSLPFVVCTEILLASAVICTYLNRRLLKSANAMDCTLIEKSRKVADFKKREIRYECIAFPILVTWIVWLLHECNIAIANPYEKQAMFYGLLCGGVFGLCWGLWIFYKMIRSANDIIKHIEEFLQEMKE
ncbi:MAG: hypothetical protein J1E57_05895 [Prevotella sp.]|nr:hypothetical protein [Prevotella sp.]